MKLVDYKQALLKKRVLECSQELLEANLKIIKKYPELSFLGSSWNTHPGEIYLGSEGIYFTTVDLGKEMIRATDVEFIDEMENKEKFIARVCARNPKVYK